MTQSAGLFDDLVETSNEVEAQAEQAEQQNESASQPESAEKNGRGAKKLPDPVRERITVQSADEVPAGYVRVKDFATQLTFRNFQKAQEEGRGPTENDLVSENAVYLATTAKRHTVPSAQLVLPDGTEVRGGIVVPLEAGTDAWDTRPERGEGGGRDLTEDQKATRVLRAGKAKARLAKLQAQVQRYGQLLAEIDKSWDDADAAYAQWAAENKAAAQNDGEGSENAAE